MITYQTRKDVLINEDSGEYVSYGIDAINKKGETILSVPDVFLEKDKVDELTRICNEESLDLDQLINIIEDALTKD